MLMVARLSSETEKHRPSIGILEIGCGTLKFRTVEMESLYFDSLPGFEWRRRRLDLLPQTVEIQKKIFSLTVRILEITPRNTSCEFRPKDHLTSVKDLLKRSNGTLTVQPNARTF